MMLEPVTGQPQKALFIFHQQYATFLFQELLLLSQNKYMQFTCPLKVTSCYQNDLLFYEVLFLKWTLGYF